VATTEEEVRIDPCGAHNFEVEINDVAVGFAEVFGLGCEFDYAEDGESVTSRVTDVTLRRGISGDAEIWSWVRSVMRGRADERTVTVRLLDDRRAEVCSWVLDAVRLRRWSGPTLRAVGGTLAMEEIVLTAQSVELVTPA
jgi:phage tail-like protein